MSSHYVSILCSCIICKQQLRSMDIENHHHFYHQHLYPKPPKNHGSCINCGKEIRDNSKSPKKFCTRSCAVIHQNSVRYRGNESRSKTSESLKRYHLNNPKKPKTTEPQPKYKYCKLDWIICEECGVVRLQASKRKYCDKCAVAKKIKNGIRSIHIKHESGVYLDSSWEIKVAEYLDSRNINWIRPNPIPYDLNGRSRKYYPDFYLPEYDLYLDPKNPYRMSKDKEKLEQVAKKINLIYGDLSLVLARLEGLEPTCDPLPFSTFVA